MSLSIAIQMDPIQSVDIDADTTFRMAEEAQARGHSLFYYRPENLSLDEGTLHARGQALTVRREKGNHFSLGEGLGGMKVKVGGRGLDKTAPSGGYGLETGEGVFNVTIKGRPVKGKITAQVEIGEDNVKLDLMDKKHLFTTGDLDLKKGAASVTALGSQAIDLTGKNGRDFLIGNDASNTLDGEGGRDRIKGEGGSDLIIGGRGNDKLWGGSGGDEFQFGLRDGRDRIYDWHKGDSLVISAPVEASDIDISANRGDAVVSFGRTIVTIDDAAGNITLDDLVF